jgi:ParB-like chromosome segregation protein Spo0J
MTKVPCVVMDDLSDVQIKKLRILDNKLNESDYDIANLRLELESLPDLNF